MRDRAITGSNERAKRCRNNRHLESTSKLRPLGLCPLFSNQSDTYSIAIACTLRDACCLSQVAAAKEYDLKRSSEEKERVNDYKNDYVVNI